MGNPKVLYSEPQRFRLQGAWSARETCPSVSAFRSATQTDDVSQRRIQELEAALQAKEQLVQKLEQANNALETFGYSVAHDLRAPLRAIVGFSRILERDSFHLLDPKGRENLDRISEGAKRMGQIIDALLDLSRSTANTVICQPADLAILARQVVGNLRGNQPERQVNFVVADYLPVAGDRQLLMILLEQLIGNAWKYTSQRTEAHIEFGYAQDQSAYFVRDNGAGFDMAHAAKLFRPFQRLHMDAEFEGSGIGLSIAKRIVDRHCGRIWAEAKINEGAVVYFTLAQAVVSTVQLNAAME